MIVIDMDMPKSCTDCLFYSENPTEYCCIASNGIPARYGYDIKTKPDWCPIKCDIEQIRDEIIELYNDRQNTQDSERTIFFRKVLNTFDKYKGDKE